MRACNRPLNHVQVMKHCSCHWCAVLRIFLSPFLQIEVVNTFKSGTSFQGALRRQSSTTSQNQDVTNVSSPSHVSLCNALSSPTSTAAPSGREWHSSLGVCQGCPWTPNLKCANHNKTTTKKAEFKEIWTLFKTVMTLLVRYVSKLAAGLSWYLASHELV